MGFVVSEHYGSCMCSFLQDKQFSKWLASFMGKVTPRYLFSAGEVNLPGWRWARIMQLALVGSSSSLHSEVCKALRGSSGVVYSKISGCGNSRTRVCQHEGTSCVRILETIDSRGVLTPSHKASQRSLHNEPIFRLLLKVAVIGAR